MLRLLRFVFFFFLLYLVSVFYDEGLPTYFISSELQVSSEVVIWYTVLRYVRSVLPTMNSDISPYNQ